MNLSDYHPVAGKEGLYSIDEFAPCYSSRDPHSIIGQAGAAIQAGEEGLGSFTDEVKNRKGRP